MWALPRILQLIGIPALVLPFTAGLLLYQENQVRTVFLRSPLPPALLCEGDRPPRGAHLACALWRGDLLALQATSLSLLSPVLLVGLLSLSGWVARIRVCREQGLLVHQPLFQWSLRLSYLLALTSSVVLNSASVALLGFVAFLFEFTLFAAFSQSQPWVSPVLCFFLEWLPTVSVVGGVLLTRASLRTLFEQPARPMPEVLGHAVSPAQMPRLWQSVCQWAEQASLAPLPTCWSSWN